MLVFHSLFLSLFSLSLLGCNAKKDSNESSDTASEEINLPDTGDDTNTSDTASEEDTAETDTADSESECMPDNLEACEYHPSRVLPTGVEILGPFEISYTDVIGETRNFSIEVRLPDDANEQTPVVVWSHGGGSGKEDPSLVANGFGELMVTNGFAFVAIAHHPRPFESYESLCQEIGLTQDQCRADECTINDDCIDFESGICVEGYCRYFKPLNWDRPHDVTYLLDRITSPDGPLSGRVNPNQLIYAGHSAGAGSSMMLAGAVRNYGTETHLLLDPRPIAFMSGSIQGPEDDGFVPQSYTGEGCLAMAEEPALCLTRPHLVLTGAGDDTTGTVAEDRRAAYDLLPTGDKYLFWNTEEAGRHTLFEYKPDSCLSYSGPGAVDPSRCETYLKWQRSAVLAFLDAYIHEDAAAIDYLNSNNIQTLSESAAEWNRK